MNSGVRLDRVPPQNIDAERSVLGAIMLSEGKGVPLATAIKKLGEDGKAFYKESNRKIYVAMLNLHDRGDPVELVTLTQELTRVGDLELVGGVVNLEELYDSCPSSANIGYYADFVLSDFLRRSLILSSSRTYNDCFDDTTEVSELVSDLEESLIQIRRDEGINAPNPIRAIIPPVLKEWERVYQSKELLTGLSTGLLDLDKFTCGWQKGEYILIAGRPSIGKSTVARNLAQYVTLDLGVPVLMFSLEASRHVVVARMLCSEAEVEYQKVRNGKTDESEWLKLTHASSRLAEAPLKIDDDCDTTAAQIRAKCQIEMASGFDAGLIIIDHIHDVSAADSSVRREQQLMSISKTFKAMARSLNVPVIALAQLNRTPDKRDGNRPSLSDLRGSGSLEQHADVVIFLYREDYYDKKTDNHEAELIVAKQRNGPTGKVRVIYDYKRDWYRSYYRRPTIIDRSKQMELEILKERVPGQEG